MLARRLHFHLHTGFIFFLPNSRTCYFPSFYFFHVIEFYVVARCIRNYQKPCSFFAWKNVIVTKKLSNQESRARWLPSHLSPSGFVDHVNMQPLPFYADVFLWDFAAFLFHFTDFFISFYASIFKNSFNMSFHKLPFDPRKKSFSCLFHSKCGEVVPE